MAWIDRYIYAVTQRLPEKQREEIGLELRSLIDDMLSLLLYQMAYSVISFALVMAMLSDSSLWNEQFSSRLADVGIIAPGTEAYQTAEWLWDRFTGGGLIYIVVVFFILDICTAAYKGYRASRTGIRS